MQDQEKRGQNEEKQAPEMRQRDQGRKLLDSDSGSWLGGEAYTKRLCQQEVRGGCPGVGSRGD